MKVLKIIHGYPPLYNAGSEVYSQTLCHELASRHEVHVFTRVENPFLSDYQIYEERDLLDSRILKHLVNLPLLRQRYRYQHDEMDALFNNLLQKINPDVVHIGHLNHLSTSLLRNIKNKGIPIVFTLHDYWLICPRGQFIQRNPENGLTPWQNCDGQEDRKCGERCYSGYFSGNQEEWKEDTDFWAHWVERRRLHLKEMIELVDIFIAPSRYLLNRFKKELNIPNSKLIYMDYGFDLERLKNRKREEEKSFVFGYIGTHTPQKGIHLLIQAFGNVKGNCCLRIWGRPRGEITSGLEQIAHSLPQEKQEKIEWRFEYSNSHIVSEVFNHVDAIVVPSIWVENSPLVIHEAQHLGVPVITADIGGMSEYVRHDVNGLLFMFRDEKSLAEQMQKMLDDPSYAKKLGRKRYLYSLNGDIPNIQDHGQEIETIYETLLQKKEKMTA